MMDDNSDTTRTSAICDFDTTDAATSCILVMLSRTEPADGLAASGEGATGSLGNLGVGTCVNSVTTAVPLHRRRALLARVDIM